MKAWIAALAVCVVAGTAVAQEGRGPRGGRVDEQRVERRGEDGPRAKRQRQEKVERRREEARRGDGERMRGGHGAPGPREFRGGRGVQRRGPAAVRGHGRGAKVQAMKWRWARGAVQRGRGGPGVWQRGFVPRWQKMGPGFRGGSRPRR